MAREDSRSRGKRGVCGRAGQVHEVSKMCGAVMDRVALIPISFKLGGIPGKWKNAKTESVPSNIWGTYAGDNKSEPRHIVQTRQRARLPRYGTLKPSSDVDVRKELDLLIQGTFVAEILFSFAVNDFVMSTKPQLNASDYIYLLYAVSRGCK